MRELPGALRVVLQSFLQSPYFLYRVEVGTPDPARPGVSKLTGFELATRLSYLLWGTTPDDELLQLAESGGLQTAADVRQ